MKIRINKLISEAGLGSRREVEEYINSGRVKINGKKAKLTDNVGLTDIVLFDDVDLPTKELIQESVAMDKVLRFEKSKIDKPRTRDKATERAESQRIQHASKSAALRKTSKNNPVNKYKARLKAELEEGEETLSPKTNYRPKSSRPSNKRTNNKLT